jgi:hypothetical protein
VGGLEAGGVDGSYSPGFDSNVGNCYDGAVVAAAGAIVVAPRQDVAAVVAA